LINIERIKNQVQRAIDTLPVQINLKRLHVIDDGYGGKITSEINVATFNGFLEDNALNPAITINDAGTIQTMRNINLTAVINEGYTIETGDYFTVNGTKYIVQYISNQYNIFWLCNLEVEK
jgi:hypothetical protein